MKMLLSLCAIFVFSTLGMAAKLVNLDVMKAISGDVTARTEIIELFENCKIDVMVDVRSRYWNEGFRLENAQHFQVQSSVGAKAFEAHWDTVIKTQTVKSIGVFCFTTPWQSTAGANYLMDHKRFENATIYDLKGLQYLSQIPEMCKYIHTPVCNEKGSTAEREACRKELAPVCEKTPPRPESFCREKMEEALKQAEYLAQQEAIQKAAEESTQRQIEEANREIEICKSAVCTEDLCSDGKGRRMINDDCCACPEDDETLMFNPKGNTDESMFAVGQPAFYGVIVGGACLFVLIIVTVFVVLRKRRIARHQVNVKVEEISKSSGTDEHVTLSKEYTVQF